MAGLFPASHDLRGSARTCGERRATWGETEIMGPRDKPGDDVCCFGSPLLPHHLGPQAAHAAEPAVVVASLALHVGEHLGVGQDQEAFGGQALDHVAGDFVGGQHAVQALGGAGAAGRGGLFARKKSWMTREFRNHHGGDSGVD